MATFTTDPLAPPLTEDEVREAVKDLIRYREVTRSHADPPVPQQSFGMLSTVIFDEPKTLSNGTKLFGFLKMRGNWSDKDLCTKKAAELVATHDSRHAIDIAEVGKWVPIAPGNRLAAESVEVKTGLSDAEKAMEDEAQKERDKQQRIMREIREREKEVRESKDLHDDPHDLKYYIMKRVVWLNLFSNIETITSQLKELQQKHVEVSRLLAEMEKKSPNFAEEWLDVYNEERKKAGIPAYKPSEGEEQTYQKLTQTSQ